MNAERAFDLIIGRGFSTLLDVGSGEGLAAARFRTLGKQVTTISLEPPADIVGNFLNLDIPEHDVVWASHVLEHQPNVNLFLRKCFDVCGEWFAVTVPPRKDEIVGGHLSMWNPGLLLYNLIIAGWDCRDANVIVDDYDISVVVRKRKANLPKLRMDFGDIEALAQFFPFDAKHGFDGWGME